MEATVMETAPRTFVREETIRLESWRRSGKAELEALDAAGIEYDSLAKEFFEGRHYQPEWLPGRTTRTIRVVPGGNRTTEQILEYGRREGYSCPHTGILPRLLETIDAEWLKSRGLGFVLVAHTPFLVAQYKSLVGANAFFFGGVIPYVHREFGQPWGNEYAFAFEVR